MIPDDEKKKLKLVDRDEGEFWWVGGSILLTKIKIESIYIQIYQWDIIAHPCSNSNGRLTIPSLKLGTDL